MKNVNIAWGTNIIIKYAQVGLSSLYKDTYTLSA